jgi:uncharacterized protein (TIGR03067 family)
MRIQRILPLVAILVLGCNHHDSSSAARTSPEKQSAPEQKGLDGTWKVVSIGGNGKTLPSEKIGDMKVHIAGQQYSTSKGGKEMEQATMTSDPSKQPKTIDLAFTKGELKGQTILGIYEVTGNTLRLAFAEPGKPHPTEIANRDGLRQDVWELRRE